MIILGIDPGLASTGYGVINTKKNMKHIEHGVISTDPGKTVGERLKKINREMKRLINKYKPDVLAIEKLYFFKNQKTAVSVFEAKGVVLLTASRKKIPVREFTPLQVKLAMVGYGRASKGQVQSMVKRILNLKKIPKPDDAADGLAIALCCKRSLKNKKSL